MTTLKEDARHIIDILPDDATWDDLMYECYVRKKIERGLKDVADGNTYTHDEIKKRFTSN